MTDRVQSLTVILDDPIRDDDVEVIVNAIRMIRYVRDVQLGPVVGVEQYIARQSAALSIRGQILDILDKEAFGKK